MVKYCVVHYRINWVTNGDINSDSILCILITWNWPISVNSIKISFLLKNSVQTLRYAVNFFFSNCKKLKAKVVACQLQKLVLNRMTVVSRPDWFCLQIVSGWCKGQTYPKKKYYIENGLLLNQIQKALDFISKFFSKLFFCWPMWVKKFKKLTSQTMG